MKNILIAGAKSYIGDAFQAYMAQYPDAYTTKILDTVGLRPEAAQFAGIDAVFCVTGIAHVKETKENRHLYFDVNRDLVIALAKAAKAAGVKQFILLSTMSVYGMETGHVTKETPPSPANAYGASKLEADEALEKLADDGFLFACLRPPMVYGKGCKGNYQSLRSFALRSPVFPLVRNQRSMIYIGNLCAFVKGIIDEEAHGLFFPQNAEYVNTSEMVRQVAALNGKKIRLTRLFNWAIRIGQIGIVKKVFGSLTYEPCDRVDTYDFAQSLRMTEEA